MTTRTSSRLAAFMIAAIMAVFVFSPASCAEPQIVPFAVRGYVHDEEGGPACNVDVTVKNLRTGQSLVVNTSEEGYYRATLGGPDYMVEDGDVVSIRAKDGELEAEETTTLPVDAAIAGTGPAYTWANLTLEHVEEGESNWLPLAAGCGVGAAAVVLVALVFMKRRKDGENEERE